MEAESSEPVKRVRDTARIVALGNEFWDACERAGLAGIVANQRGETMETLDGHQFVNFSCCSYLGLDQHPRVVEGAIEHLRRYGLLDYCIPRSRVQLPALNELEATLSEMWRVQAVSAISASVASQGMLPLVASGELSGRRRPLMVFDKACHVSMAQAKPSCAQEAEVQTCRHHDLEFLETQCRRNELVCYVCDGADSLGGYAPVSELVKLQERYGLLVFYDDSHALSVRGEKGEGFVLSQMKELNDRTIIVATLNKAFGATGAAVLLGGQSRRNLRVIERFSGGMSYSQPLSIPGIGAALASAQLHAGPELSELQQALQQRIALFDSLVPTAQSGEAFPIRLVSASESLVVEAGRSMLHSGFYVSPVFFPIVARGSAGLRVMLRANHREDDVRKLCAALKRAQLN